MSFYISNPVVADWTVIKQRFTDYLTAYGPPGFQLQPGEPIDLLAEAAAVEAAQQADVVNQLLDDAFRYLGGLFNLPPIDASPASATATFTVQDTLGYTVNAGAEVGLKDSTGTLQSFRLLADVVIAPAASTGTGTVQADQAGAICNGLSGTATPLSVPPYVTAISVATTSGGIDAELTATFMDRLAETFTLLTPRPALSKDFAVLARAVPGVYRAVGVDNLKPGPPYDGAAEATGVEDNLTVAVTDINGASVGSTVRANVKTYLQSFVLQNSVIWVVDPQSVAIDVSAPGVFSWPGWDSTAVQSAVIAALTAALSPATFGTDPSGNAARWSNDPWVRFDLIANTIRQVPGVRYITPQPTFRVSGGTLATADIHLGASSAIPALPTPGTISVTVTPTT